MSAKIQARGKYARNSLHDRHALLQVVTDQRRMIYSRTWCLILEISGKNLDIACYETKTVIMFLESR